VLRANVLLPLIPTSKRALAPSKIEDAEEGPGVYAYYVALECSFIFKGGVIAGLAGVLTFVLTAGERIAATLDWLLL
jgi:hypothetical protein